MGLMTTLGGFWKSLVSRQLHVTLTISFVYTIVKLTCLVLSFSPSVPNDYLGTKRLPQLGASHSF